MRIALLVLATVLLLLANLGGWFRASVLDSSEFTGTVDGVLRQPEATERVSDVLATQALASGELEARIAELLPRNGPFVTALLNRELHDIVARVLQELLSIEPLQDAIETSINRAHDLLVTFLEGRREDLSIEDGQLVLDLRAVLEELFGRLGLSLPERLAGANAGEVVLVEDARNLDLASSFVKGIDEYVPLLVLLAILGYAGAVFVARDRPRTLMLCGYAVVAAGVISLVVWRTSNMAFESLLAERRLAVMILEGLTEKLKWQSLGLIVLGGAIALVADVRVRTLAADLAGRTEQRLAGFGHGRALLVAAAILVFLLLVF